MASEHKPFIDHQTILPETTVKAVALGFLLSAVLAGANAYLGLLLGMTVSASIPAAVISMAVLKLFRKSNILENNVVQTAASAGESLAAGVIFTLPALVLMQYWTEFNYIETTLIALSGGILGVLFTIPLRNALIVREKLKFPEGVATAEVLKVGNQGGALLKHLIIGSLLGAVVKFAIEGLKLWGSKFQIGTIVQGKGFLYFGTYLTPAVMAVGYIVGLNIAILVFMGGAISWYIAIPAYVGYFGAPEGADAASFGLELWSTKIRYLGVGAMIIGGLWAIFSIRGSLLTAIRHGITTMKQTKDQASAVIRTEYDTPMGWVILGVGVLIVPIFIIYLREVESVAISALMAILMVNAGFLFSAVAGYMAGLVGSSNNPISGVTIATILTSALILVVLVGTDSPIGGASAILIGAVVCCAAAIAGDNMQDLKSGYILGATPFRQQIMQVVGVVAAALVLAPILNLLNDAYVIGSPNLSAPQASLMQSVAEGVFGGELPWDIIGIGCGIGALIIIADLFLEKKNSNFRMPVLAVAVGMYLPLYLDTAIFIGGIIAWLVNRFYKKQKGAEQFKTARIASDNAGLLFASGLITGEALLGIFMAIPIAISGDSDVMKFFDFQLPDVVGLGFLVLCCLLLYTTITRTYKRVS